MQFVPADSTEQSCLAYRYGRPEDSTKKTFSRSVQSSSISGSRIFLEQSTMSFGSHFSFLASQCSPTDPLKHTKRAMGISHFIFILSSEVFYSLLYFSMHSWFWHAVSIVYLLKFLEPWLHSSYDCYEWCALPGHRAQGCGKVRNILSSSLTNKTNKIGQIEAHQPAVNALRKLVQS